jgi:hypothetical protein
VPKLRFDVEANGAQARRELASTRGEVESFGRSADNAGNASERSQGKLSRFTSGLGAAAKAFGPLAAAAAGAAIVKIGIDSVKAASDLNEEASKSKQIFGASSAAIDKWASSAAKNLGQSKQQALEATSTFGLIGQKAGLSGEATAKFSTQFAGLASDLASFNNTSPQEAIDAIGSAMRGEAEPIRKYGVLLDEATLKAEAMKIGLLKPVKDQAKIQAYHVAVISGQQKYNDAVKEFGPKSLEALKAEANLGTARDRLKKATEGTIPALTQQQKVLAAGHAIMEQTTKAQGDFERTSGGLANQQRILAAQFENTKAKAGQVLLPALTGVLKVVNGLFNPSDKVRAVFHQIGEVASSYLSPIIKATRGAIEQIRGSFDGAGGKGEGLRKILKLIGDVAAFAAPIIGKTLALQIKALGTAISLILGTIDKLVSGLEKVAEWAGKAIDKVKDLGKLPGVKQLGGLFSNGDPRMAGLARIGGGGFVGGSRVSPSITLTSSPAVTVEIDSPALARLFRVIVRDELQHVGYSGGARP